VEGETEMEAAYALNEAAHKAIDRNNARAFIAELPSLDLVVSSWGNTTGVSSIRVIPHKLHRSRRGRYLPDSNAGRVPAGGSVWAPAVA